MTKSKSLTIDAIIWIVFLALAAIVAFNLLQRDKERHFGAVAYGGFPSFHLKTIQGDDFDEHHIKAHVWVVHTAASEPSAMAMARRLSAIEQLTASGKRHFYILTFVSSASPILKPVIPAHYIVVGEPKKIDAILASAGGASEGKVFLVDQDGIIRGKYDLDNVDEFRSFQQDILRIL